MPAMNRMDDVMLMAYVDGEVDAATAREIEAAIGADAALAMRVAMFRQTASLMRGAFTEVLHEPVPDRLVSQIRAARPAVASLAPVDAGTRAADKIGALPPRHNALKTSPGWRNAGWSTRFGSAPSRCSESAWGCN